jgi:hypothetical protein
MDVGSMDVDKGGADDAQREQKHDDDDKAKGMRRDRVRFQST